MFSEWKSSKKPSSMPNLMPKRTKLIIVHFTPEIVMITSQNWHSKQIIKICWLLLIHREPDSVSIAEIKKYNGKNGNDWILIIRFSLSLSSSVRTSIKRCHSERYRSQSICIHFMCTACSTEKLDRFQSAMLEITSWRTIHIERSSWCWYVPPHRSPGNDSSLRAYIDHKAHCQWNWSTTNWKSC